MKKTSGSSHTATQSAPKKEHFVPISANRRATFDYYIEKKIEAGIQLTGSEVKSCRAGKVQLVDSFATIEKDECFLHKAHIAEYAQGGPYFNHPPVRRRKLLMHTREIRDLKARTEQEGYTLIPLRMYFKNGKAKVELGLGKGKTKSDKRSVLKEKEDVRNMDRAVRRTTTRSSRDYDDE